MPILHFCNRRNKRSNCKLAAKSSAPIELAGLSTNGQSTTLFLRRGRERRQVALEDVDLAYFGQSARRAIWATAAARRRRTGLGRGPVSGLPVRDVTRERLTPYEKVEVANA